MIVVEGPDGGGKSTLCKLLCSKFNLKMGERSEKNRDEIYKTTRDDTWRAMYIELMCREPSLVWDRLGPISDPIYASLDIPHPRKISFSYSEIGTFLTFVQNLGLVIVCLPPYDVAEANARRGHQLQGVDDKFELIYRSYSQGTFTQGALVYDYTDNHSHQYMIRMVNIYLQSRKEHRECYSSGTPAT